MKSKNQKLSAAVVIVIFALFMYGVMVSRRSFHIVVTAQDKSVSANAEPTPEFDQEAALARLREKINGKEQLPSGEVFENIQNFKDVPAGRLLAIMSFGYARSLGVDCTHCHVPEKWESEEKPTKQIARDMHKMAAAINGELLKNMKSLGERQANINCTTCHRGEIKPALILPSPKTE